MKRQAVWMLVGLMTLTSYTFAQEAPSPAPGAPNAPGEQNAPGGRRGNRQQGMRPGQGRPGGMMELPESFKLTEEQKTKINEIYQNSFREMRDRRSGATSQANNENMQKAMQLRRQLSEAAQAGDDTRVQQIQTEIDALSTSQERAQMQERVYSQIEQVLNTRQRQQFEQWKKLRASGLPPQLIDRPEALKTAALKITTLSDIQKNTIEAAFERYSREATHADEAAKADLNDRFASEVLSSLKPSQKVLLTNTAMREGRGNRGLGGLGAPGAAPGAVQPGSAQPTQPAQPAGQ